MHPALQTIIATALFYVCIGIGGVALYIALFYFGILDGLTVLFYRGIALLIIVVVIQLIVGLCALSLTNLGFRAVSTQWPHAIAAASLTLTINMAFLILVPVTLDRSVSVFMLGAMSDGDHAIWTKDEMRHALVHTYIDGYDAVNRRFDEQIKSGNIEKAGDGYRLTAAGSRFVAFAILMARAFHIDDRFVQPKAHLNETRLPIDSPSQ